MAQTSTQRPLIEYVKPTVYWVTKEGRTLEVPLKDFKKDEIKVQLDNSGKLNIIGEHQIPGNRSSRFSLKFDIPKNCNVNEIKAKFTDGILTVSLPTKTTREHFQEEVQPTQPPEKLPPKEDEQTIQTQEKIPANEASKETEGITKKNELGMGGNAVKSKRRTKVVVSIALAVSLVVALGFYTLYRLRSSFDASGEDGM